MSGLVKRVARWSGRSDIFSKTIKAIDVF